MNETPETQNHFLRQLVEEDLAAGLPGGKVVTRFPPEPNGWPHIGHAKAVWINYGLAKTFNGDFNLRMDDTNPSKESEDFVEALKADLLWLGCPWDNFIYASDAFETMRDIAVALIHSCHAYICEVPQDDWKDYRGVPTSPGKESPWRNRPAAESLALFEKMCAGEINEGAMCLRAKIDMASPNIHLRDPVIYRVLHMPHYRAGTRWKAYPMYDFAHSIEDALEGVTHSLCSIEFEVHRPLYDWVIDRLAEMNRLIVRNGETVRPKQREFARLNISHTVMSKRFLLDLVREKKVNGWDDPRMPTLSGFRRRGYTPGSIRDFCERVGVSKYKSLTEHALLESCIRDDLNRRATRRMAVINPVKVVIDNFDGNAVEFFDAPNNPEDPAAGSHKVPFSRELWIERDDFMEVPEKKFFRVSPGQEVRLRYACLFKCTHVEKDADGNVAEIHGAWDPASRGGASPDGRKVKATIHWVSVKHAVPVEVRLYDKLFTVPEPQADENRDPHDFLNPASLVVRAAFAEPALADAAPGEHFQFERLAYFCVDPDRAADGRPVFNRTVTLKSGN
ncbi:MAG: glutamine--tRNA ligase/YqeY domain fusion protein [Kiritimatiellaeota bacterium]|nr:glutamine--tRNA ligase/YqeY domain fusion protein [Kiritimatiellota bacterium]